MRMESQLPIEGADANTSVVNLNTNNRQSVSDSPPTIVTVRMIVDGKEVGSIIGKKGDNVKRYRESSGAKINISDASCAERIVTITGMLEQIRIAFNLMCIKFEDDLRANTSPGSTLPPVNVRLVIPASQCGSLIGKGGTKIKELRETTGACVQVASDMLPGSTERVVTITGGATSISNCVTEVCSIMLESPPKGATIPYRPKPALQTTMMYGMPTAFGIPGQTPGHPGHSTALPGATPALAGQPAMAMAPNIAAVTMASPASSHPQMSSSEACKLVGAQPTPAFSQAGMITQQALAGLTGQPISHMSQQGAPLILPPSLGAVNPYAAFQPGLGVPAMNAMNSLLAAGGRPISMLGAIQAQQQQQQQHNQSTEMVIPNELIGCIIGRGGAKINEIRQLSGAQIKISNCEEGTNDRKVTITGYPDTIAMATYLINTSVEIHKAQLLMASQEQATTTNPGNAAAPANLTPSSVSSQSNSQTQMTSSLVTAVSNSAQLQQQLQKQQQQQVTQNNGTAAYAAALPYNLSAALPAGYSFAAAPQYGLTAAYDPKTVLAAATAANNKLKMLPTPTGMKLEQRFAPY